MGAPDVARARIVRAAPVVALLALFVAVAAAAALLSRPARPSSADASPPSFVPTVIRDVSGAPVLSVRLGGANPGDFDLQVATVGDYQGVATLDPAQTPPVYQASGTVAGTFTPANGGASVPVNLSVTFHIVTGPGPSPSGTASVGVSGTTYSIHTDDTPAASAQPAFQQVMNALGSQNWTALYALESSPVASGVDQATFVNRMLAQPSPGDIVSITATGPDNETSALGFRYDTLPIVVSLRGSDGTTVDQESHITLVLENGRWLLAGTDPAAP